MASSWQSDGTAQAAALRSLSQLAALSEPLSLHYRTVIAAALQLPSPDLSQATHPQDPGPASELRMDLSEDAAAPPDANMDDLEPMADHTQPLQLPTPAAELCTAGCKGGAALQLPHASPDQLIQPLEVTPALCRTLTEAAKERASKTAAPYAGDSSMACAGRHIDEGSQGSASIGMQQSAARSTADVGMPPVDVAAGDAVMLVEVSACVYDPHLQECLGTCCSSSRHGLHVQALHAAQRLVVAFPGTHSDLTPAIAAWVGSSGTRCVPTWTCYVLLWHTGLQLMHMCCVACWSGTAIPL